MDNKRVYVRTDKNGTKIYRDYTCRRCGGYGASEAWKFTGMTCYECGGTGVSTPHIVMEYTPEYAAKLEAKRKARWAKLQAELKAQAQQLNTEFLATYFPTGKCYCLALTDKNSWEVMDELKAEGVQYDNSIGYYFTAPTTKFPTVEVTPEEVTALNYEDIRVFHVNAWKVIEAKIKALKPVSQYVGTVGQKLTVTAKYTHTAWYETKFGTTYIHNFVTAEGNQLVWKTGSGYVEASEGDTVTITATVKDHSEYKDNKQTALMRCKITVQG